MNPLSSRRLPLGRARATRLARQALAVSLALAPCLVWAIESTAAQPFDDRAVGTDITFSMGHAAPAGRTFADAVADPPTPPMEASTLGQSMADARAARGSFASAFAVAEAVPSVDITAPVTAVPEPGTYMLMLVGLGVIAFVVRRRRRLD